MSTIVSLLDRKLYTFAQVDSLLRLPSGTSRRWVNGYERGGKRYLPVIRESATSRDVVTWGEFVESRLLSEYRSAGVPLARLRPAVQALRNELQIPYPLASARLWLDVEGRELVRRVQTQVGLEQALLLVVVRSGQTMTTKSGLEWSAPAESFSHALTWNRDREPESLRPDPHVPEVEVHPLRGYGAPVVRGVRTELIAELLRAGDSREAIADLYELQPQLVDAAILYEQRAQRPA